MESDEKATTDLPLYQLIDELHRIPRHQWDRFLWKICEEMLAKERPSGHA